MSPEAQLMRAARWRNKQFEMRYLAAATTEHDAVRQVEALLNKGTISPLNFVAQRIGRFLSADHTADSACKQSSDRDSA